jgi:hypothetical protein
MAKAMPERRKPGKPVLVDKDTGLSQLPGFCF